MPPNKTRLDRRRIGIGRANSTKPTSHLGVSCSDVLELSNSEVNNVKLFRRFVHIEHSIGIVDRFSAHDSKYGT